MLAQPMLSTDGPGTGQIEDFKETTCSSDILNSSRLLGRSNSRCRSATRRSFRHVGFGLKRIARMLSFRADVQVTVHFIITVTEDAATTVELSVRYFIAERGADEST